MANRHGDFIWYELLTTDADAAARFYEAVIGWNARAFEGSDIGYRLFSIGGTDVAGFMPIPADAKGMRPGWLGYVGVDDVDKIAAEIVQVGGTQHMPPTDIPGVGRFAMVADPQGVPFYVMRGAIGGHERVLLAEADRALPVERALHHRSGSGARLLQGPLRLG